MGPLTRKAMASFSKEGQELVAEAMHIMVPLDMAKRIHELAVQVPVNTPFEGRLPWDPVVVEIDGFAAFLVGTKMFNDRAREFDIAPTTEEADEFNRILNARWDEVIHIHCVADCPGPEGTIFKTRSSFLCGYLPGEAGLMFAHFDKGISEGKEMSRETITTVLDLLFSFMAEPRYIYQANASPLKRKAANKHLTKRGMPALKGTWVKLGWVLGKATKSGSNEHADGPQKAFHMVRAHWRRSPYDHQTPKAVRRPHRPGWWMWIEAQYRGHPALGVIHHSYQPKLEDPGASSAMVHKVMAAKQAGGKKFVDRGLSVN